MDIKKLMSPESVVVVGATNKPGMPGNASESVLLGVNEKHVYYLNPRRDFLHGRKCYKCLSELPEVTDCIVLCTPAETIPSYLEEAGMLGIGAAVVFASGFGEERTQMAQRLAREVEEICIKYDIALCGPNCVGIINVADKKAQSAMNAVSIKEMFCRENRRGIAVIGQSGYISSGFMSPDTDYLSYIVSAGNCSICSIEDYMYYMAEDESVNCIAVYVEEIKKPAKLVSALKLAAEKKKPVVALKAGSSEKGSYAVASHTGSLAGNYKIYESVLKKFGVILTGSLQEFAATARAFAVLDGNLPKREGLGGLNFSGGENTLCADICEAEGIWLPEYGQKTTELIHNLIPSYATASNPLDATTTLFSEKERVKELFLTLSCDKNIGLISVGSDVGEVPEEKDITSAAVLEEMKRQGNSVPVVVVPSFEKNRNKELVKKFENAGVPVLSTGILAYRMIRHIFDFSLNHPDTHTLELAIPEENHFKEVVNLSEAESKNQLSAYGVKVPKQVCVAEISELEGALQKFSCPVVMKIDSPDIAHKTDAGGVKLGIRSLVEAQEAYDSILSGCRAYAPNAKIHGVMVQEMVPKGVEMILGVKNDPLFGPMMLVGFGGVFVEIFKDTALYPCPLNRNEAEKMIKSLKSYPLLNGYRGSQRCDIDALTDLMVKISEYAADHKNELKEMDLNPVTVLEKGKGVIIVDALIVKNK